MESVIILANFMFWMYSCGVDLLTGCSFQIVSREKIINTDGGKFITKIINSKKKSIKLEFCYNSLFCLQEVFVQNLMIVKMCL